MEYGRPYHLENHQNPYRIRVIGIMWHVCLIMLMVFTPVSLVKDLKLRALYFGPQTTWVCVVC